MQRLSAVPVLGTALRVQRRYTEDAADALAASIGFFGFLSLFPLLSIAVAFVGFAVDDPAVKQDVVDLMVRSVPALGALMGDSAAIGEALDAASENAGSLLGLGTVLTLLAGLRIANGAQQASAVVFRTEVPSGLGARAGQLGALVVVGLLALAGAAVASDVGVDLGTGVVGLASSLGTVGLAYAIDVGVFLVAYRLFTPGPGPDWHVLLPGSLLAGAGWVALKLFGTSYVTRQASSRSSLGAVGAVIALLLLFYLAGRLYVYGAELAALLAGIDDDGESDADRAAVGRAGGAAGGVGPPYPPVPRHPLVSPQPQRDEAPEPTALGGLALTAVVVAAIGAALDRILRR